MLSERDRQVLDSIEADLSAVDQRFADGMRSGRPHPPREYRRTWSIVLTVLGVLAFAAILATGHPLAVVALVTVAITALVRFVSRRLDAA
jgi:Flp pilus assembly protein TadB